MTHTFEVSFAGKKIVVAKDADEAQAHVAELLSDCGFCTIEAVEKLEAVEK